jgi:hypothetical protein
MEVIFDKSFAAKDSILQYFIVPNGVIWLPILITMRFIYIRIFRYIIDILWNILCKIYLVLVELYISIGETPSRHSHKNKKKKM